MCRALLLSFILCSAASAQVDAWRADLAHLVDQLPRRHIRAFSVVEESVWRAEAKQLDARLGDLKDDAAFEFELMKLVARLGDSHTTISTKHLGGDDHYPLGIYWFSDGPRIIKTPREHREFLGWKLEGIDKASMAEVRRKLGAVQVFDNEARVRSGVPRLITWPKLLYLAGLSASADSATFQLERGGETRELELKPGGFGVFPARRTPGRTMTTARQGSKWFWTKFFPAEGLLYVQYNRCRTSGQWNVTKLATQLARRMATGEVKTFVFDVQYNGGGSSIIADMMFAQLARHEPFRSRKNLFCIVGRQTFSSAILNAMTLKSRYGAQLIGEATGGSPNHFGELRTFELPNSRLTVRYSTKYFARGKPGAKTIEPDHAAEMSYADFIAGRDRTLDKIRALVATRR